jgi:hypothetical protein
MNDEQMQALLDTWYRDREMPRPKVQSSVAKVMANVPQTHQRGRWWPLPALDRPRSTFPSGELAPAPIPATNGHQPARGFTMFSAVKFIAAGVIVALFGSFLLSGIFTTQQEGEALPAAVTESPAPAATAEATGTPDPSIRTDILPGVKLTVEGVEPGVYRVVHDGIRDLAKANDFDIVAGHDGGIWLLRPKWFFRLGTQGAHDWPTEAPKHVEFEVAPDGTVWVQAEGALQSFDGKGWTTHFEDSGWQTLEVAPGGTVWATWPDPEQGREVFGYLDDDGWHAFGDAVGSLLVASPDDIWAMVGTMVFPYPARFVDGEWQRLDAMEVTDATGQQAGGLARDDDQLLLGPGLGPDGTLWLWLRGFPNDNDDVVTDLVRFDGSDWSRWSILDTELTPMSALEVAPDGSVWAASGLDGCDGVGYFDGVTPDHYLPGHCVKAIDITAGGAAWVLAKGPGVDLRQVYVIIPEAMAAGA